MMYFSSHHRYFDIKQLRLVEKMTSVDISTGVELNMMKYQQNPLPI